MLLLMFDSCAAPVMVQAGGKRKSLCLKCKQTTMWELPFISKVKRQRKTAEDVVDGRQPVFLDSTMDFPFLCDPYTMRYVQKSKVMFMMRGLPGSGKSTLVRAITNSYPSHVVCSADDYFIKDGQYAFDAAGLSDAHSACQDKAKDACNADVGAVVVDNTNVRRWEMKFYLDLASHRDYMVVPVQPKTAWRFIPQELAARNKHGVDVETLARKVIYCALFLFFFTHAVG
jgi:predicted kinase